MQVRHACRDTVDELMTENVLRNNKNYIHPAEYVCEHTLRINFKSHVIFV